MSGSENILCCPHMAMHLIESSHDLLSSGYTYDSVPPGRAPRDPIKDVKLGFTSSLLPLTWLATMKAKPWGSSYSLPTLTKAISLSALPPTPHSNPTPLLSTRFLLP